jgi:sRNA-binding carbon storage regulator CsrA
MSKKNKSFQINYQGPEILDDDCQLTVVSVKKNKVVFHVDDEDNCVIVGEDIVQLLVAEGIVAILTKAVNREDGYSYLTGGTDGERIETSSDTGQGEV